MRERRRRCWRWTSPAPPVVLSPDGSRRLGVYAPDGGVEYAYTIGSALVSVRDAEGTAYFSPQGEMLFRAAEDESVSAWYARTDDTDPQRVVVQTANGPTPSAG